MSKEPTKAEMNAKKAMMEWKAKNRQFKRDAAARRAKDAEAARQGAAKARKAAK